MNVQNGNVLLCLYFRKAAAGWSDILESVFRGRLTSDEQSKLHQYARILVYLLQRTEERLSFTEEIGESQTMLRLVQEQAQLNDIERQNYWINYM
jgi:hypothetical protein